jgi:hypothetical protein
VDGPAVAQGPKTLQPQDVTQGAGQKVRACGWGPNAAARGEGGSGGSEIGTAGASSASAVSQKGPRKRRSRRRGWQAAQDAPAPPRTARAGGKKDRLEAPDIPEGPKCSCTARPKENQSLPRRPAINRRCGVSGLHSSKDQKLVLCAFGGETLRPLRLASLAKTNRNHSARWSPAATGLETPKPLRVSGCSRDRIPASTHGF